MMASLIVWGLPLILYAVLILLPRGRAALNGCLMAGVGIALVWVLLVFDIGGLAQRDTQTGMYLLVFAVAITVAWGLAGSMQALRLRLPANWPFWAWPLFALIALATAAFPVLRTLGI